MASDLDQTERDLRAVLAALRLIRARPSLPPQLVPTLDAGIAATEHALARLKTIEPDNLTATG